MLEPRYEDGTIWLRMVALEEGRLNWSCHAWDPDGERVACCCECAGCCDSLDWEECDCPAHSWVGRECTCNCDHTISEEEA